MRRTFAIGAICLAAALTAGCTPMVYVDSRTETGLAVCYNHYWARRQQAVDVAVNHCAAQGLIARETGRNAYCETGGSWRELTFECTERPTGTRPQRSTPPQPL